MKQFRNAFIILMGGFLVGCAGTSEDPSLNGMGKKPITEINSLIESDEFGSKITPLEPVLKQRTKAPFPFSSYSRSLEETVCLWIPPYEDEGGNLHSDQKVYVVVKKSKWNPMPSVS